MRTPEQLRHAQDIVKGLWMCDSCGRFYHEDSMTFIEDIDKTFCRKCMEEQDFKADMRKEEL